MTNNASQSNNSWGVRFLKGFLIGSGFIVPGVSGGALATVFGLYERIINFLANITENFLENVKYFLPVGLGAVAGIAFFAAIVSFLLGNYETMIQWFFVGAVLGTAPDLWQQAGKQGRSRLDLIIMVVSFLVGLILLNLGSASFTSQIEANFGIWVFCGFLIALGVLIPGLSPSNFILYMGLYKEMSDAFKSFDLSVIIPIAIGGLLTVLLLSKLIEYIFKRWYSQFFHFIFGIVIASTLMIIPTDYSGMGILGYVMCFVMLIAGIALGAWMSSLE